MLHLLKLLAVMAFVYGGIAASFLIERIRK